MIWVTLGRWLLGALRWLIGTKEGRVALIAVLAVATFLEYGHRRFSAGAASERAKLEAQATRAAVHAAFAQLDGYMAGAKRLAEIDSSLEQQHADALAAKDRLIAGLRAGTVRLQHRFTCPAVASQPAAASSAGNGETPAGFTAADAEVAFGIVADGDDAIRDLTACQATVTEYQRIGVLRVDP